MSLTPIGRTEVATLSVSGPSSIVAWAEAAQAAHQLAAPLCRTDFVPQHFRGNENAATAAVLYGAEVGLSPLQALQGLFVIGGRPAMYARTMLAVTLGAGHEVWTEESTDARAVVFGRRRGSDHVEKVVVTMEQARKAGWTKNGKYNTEPATMLLARAQSQACRRIAPDALLGLSYSAEELLDEDAVAPEPKKTARRKTTVEVVPTPEPDLKPAEVTGEAITQPQSAKLHALLREGGHDRDSGLALLGGMVGRPLDTTSELTKAEASEVIDALEADHKVPEEQGGAEATDEPPLWPEVQAVPE